MELMKDLLEHMTDSKIFSAKDFSFKGNQFTAFASDLGKGREFTGPIYNDSADSGLFIRSPKTGKLACYAMDENGVRDRENDITHWELTPVRKHPSLLHNNEIADWNDYKDTKITVWNT